MERGVCDQAEIRRSSRARSLVTRVTGMNEDGK